METLMVLPPELESVIGSERRDFILQSKRAQSRGRPLWQVVFGILWTSILLFGMGIPFYSILSGQSTSIEENQLPMIIFPAFFLLIGFSFIGWGLYSLLKKGGIFVATPTRLIRFAGGNITSMAWSQFSGNMEIGKQSILLEMKTGKMQRTKHGSYFVPATAYISGLDNVLEIEALCRKRIQENDTNSPK